MNMECKNCGKTLKKDMAYCPYCGMAKDARTEEFSVASDDLVKKVKQLIHEGNIRRIIIKDESGKQLLEIPMTLGVLGIVIAPWLAALGVIGAVATNCKIVVERRQ
jgi:uncharacterized membrane protein YvbJ